jgi:hypothetical protein
MLFAYVTIQYGYRGSESESPLPIIMRGGTAARTGKRKMRATAHALCGKTCCDKMAFSHGPGESKNRASIGANWHSPRHPTCHNDDNEQPRNRSRTSNKVRDTPIITDGVQREGRERDPKRAMDIWTWTWTWVIAIAIVPAGKRPR